MPKSLASPITKDAAPPLNIDRADILNDYYLGRVSRELSNFIRRDVMTGRAKFGISDDGKELFQLAQAKAIKQGDWRSDYYRGHTLLLATGQFTVADLLAQLYADAQNDPFSKGRQMNNHHATRTVGEDGQFVDLLQEPINISSGSSPTAGQMSRALGLGLASKIFREAEHFNTKGLSDNGNEICWASIGDASTSEGIFWETMNAAGLLEVPMAVTVADDGYGISVPTDLQTTKGSISDAMAGFQVEEGTNGIHIYKVKGWDYPALCRLYPMVAEEMRTHHRTALIHVCELTQPNGHSTSGSHERYKDKKRLQFEKEYDCLRQFRLWMLGTGVAEAEELDEIEARAKKDVKIARQEAWDNFTQPQRARRDAAASLLSTYQTGHSTNSTGAGQIIRSEAGYSQPQQQEAIVAAISQAQQALLRMDHPLHSEVIDHLRHLTFKIGKGTFPALDQWISQQRQELSDLMSTHLYSETPLSPLRLSAVAPDYGSEPVQKNGYEILQHYFMQKFKEMDNLYAFGEDVGQIGDVNQGFAGIQEAFGEHRIFDTGIREWSILGQGQGMAMRGLRPIAEIQYLDYIFYAFSQLADDIATLRWRSAGLQACPMIIRTRGHRLEGVWHSGSYLMPLVSSFQGIHICVPRNSVQAIGFYNTLLAGDDPGLVVEVLNGYRRKEYQPKNLTSFRVPLGVPECLREGSDLTIVTYGVCARICMDAADILAQQGLEVEIIDVQTLLPFDLEHRISQHLKHTNRLLIVDEDVPGGTSAFLLQQITEQQGGFLQLDAPVKTLTAKAHRPAYADDGDYASKPQVADVVDAAWEVALF